MIIDVSQRMVEIRPSEGLVVSHCSSPDPGNSVPAKRDVVSFRFKEIQGYVEHCRDFDNAESSRSLILTLKHAPRLEKESADAMSGESKRSRICDEIFGQCIGYRLYLDDTSLFSQQEGLKKLQDFGVVPRDEQPLTVRTKPLERRPLWLDTKLEHIHQIEPDIGMCELPVRYGATVACDPSHMFVAKAFCFALFLITGSSLGTVCAVIEMKAMSVHCWISWSSMLFRAELL